MLSVYHFASTRVTRSFSYPAPPQRRLSAPTLRNLASTPYRNHRSTKLMSKGFEIMGRRRIHTDPREPLPPGLNKMGRKFRARRSSASEWKYFGDDYVG